MSVFPNTVGTLGDNAITDSMIDRSITTLYDQLAYRVGPYAFHNCNALTEAGFSDALYINLYAFASCSALKKVDLPKAQEIGSMAFSYSTALETLILRKTDGVCSLASGGLGNTAIAAGNGYIYVPAALVDSYKTETNWSTYADQIRAIEDWPSVCSYAGQVWIKSSFTTPISKVLISNGVWIADGIYGLYYSTDGKTWNASNIEDSSYFLSSNEIVFVAYKLSNGLYYSDDGKTWYQSNITSGNFNCAAYGNDVWVASGNSEVYYSEDGKTWVLNDTISSGFSKIKFADGMFVASNSSGLYYSTDGMTWTLSNIAKSGCYFILNAANLWVACFAYDNAGVYYSTDGMTWSKSGSITDNCFCAIYGNGCFLVGTNGGIYKSSSGTTWERISTLSTFSLAYGIGLFVAGTYSNGLYFSKDGTTWYQSNKTSGRCDIIAYGNAMFASNIAGSLYYSD